MNTKFTYADYLNQMPLPTNEKWREGVWDFENFSDDFVTRVEFWGPEGGERE